MKTILYLCLFGVVSCFSSPPFLTRTTRCSRISPTFVPTQRAYEAALSATTSNSSGRQVLEFQEPRTNVTVVLVGSMHYNPTSIQLAIDTTQGLACRDLLGSVIIESCFERWNETNSLYEQQPMLEGVLENEMRAASHVAFSNNVPVVLGDQCINATVEGIKSTFGETLLDLVRRPFGLYQDMTREIQLALPPIGSTKDEEEEYLDVSCFLDPKLLLAFPVSLVKYPLSYIVRSPLKGVAFSLLVLVPLVFSSQQLPDDGLFLDIQDVIGSILFAILEVVVFTRIFAKELLVKRNEVLARNILLQCQRIRNGDTTEAWVLPTDSWWSLIVPSKNVATAKDMEANFADDIVYAAPLHNEDQQNMKRSGHKDKNHKPLLEESGDKAVVAVLGLAHCNGIKKLLREELI